MNLRKKISVLGYQKNSPYRGNPYLDIDTPDGLIDMSNTDIPLIGVDETGMSKVMMPYSGTHKFDGSKVREIPIEQQGGLFSTNKVGYVDSVFNANQNLNWVQRLYQKNTPSIQIPGQPYRSTHFMESGDGRVYPTVVMKDGRLQYLGKDAGNYADSTNTYIQFPNDEMAQWFGNNYKMGTNVLGHKKLGGKFQKGGALDFLFNEDDEFDSPNTPDESDKPTAPSVSQAQQQAPQDTQGNPYDTSQDDLAMETAMSDYSNPYNTPKSGANYTPQGQKPSTGQYYLAGIDPKVQAATNELMAKFPGLQITSGIRSWGDKDAHPKGRAIDVAGSHLDQAFNYYKNILVPKYGFNPALNPNHGTGPHIHVGYY